MKFDRNARWTDLRIILPFVHIVLLATTSIVGMKAASGGNPFAMVDLPVSIPLVARDDWPTVTAVGVLGTLWWCFIGWIGWSSTKGRISRIGAGLGSALILFFCLSDSYAMISQFSCCISTQPNLSLIDFVIYFLAVGLLFGGLISAILSARAVFWTKRS
jgi:hypothetical protein